LLAWRVTMIHQSRGCWRMLRMLACRKPMTARPLGELMAGLPPQASEADLFADLRHALGRAPRPLVVIDDDPTGVQTVHDTQVLLSWSNAELRAQMARAEDVFFVLTNSRSMPAS